MKKWRIKKGDNVQVIAGQDKGVKGEVLRVLRDEDRVVVKGVHVCTRHQKPSATNPGGRIKKEQSIHVSNVMLYDEKAKVASRVRNEIRDGKKVRVYVKSGNVVK